MAIFSSAHLKLRRARDLIDELDTLLAKRLADNPVQSEFVEGSGGDGWSPTTKVVFPPPPEMTPAIIGDIIHNIRTSLDHMASEMARLKGRPDKHVYFPFGEDANGLERMIEDKNFTYCGADAVDLLRTLKPYRQGNVELRAIHDLDVLDKHRELLPEPGILPGGVKSFEPTGPLVDGQRPIRWIPMQFTDIAYAFPSDSVLTGRPIIHVLKELVELCEGVLESFATLQAQQEAGADAKGDNGRNAQRSQKSNIRKG